MKKAENTTVTPKLRFPEFRDAEGWKSRRLGNLFSNRQESGLSNLPLLSLMNKEGIVPQENSNRKNNSNSDKSKYLRVVPGDIAYNTMRMWEGRSAFVGLEGLVSPAYTVCEPKERVHSLLFSYYFKTPQLIEQFRRYSQGLVKDTLGLKYEPFSKISVFAPRFEEQQKIADCLSSVDELIAAHGRKLAALRDHKKGLMQQLFPRKDETQPRLRFPEFQNDGDWVEEKLKDIVHFQDGFAFKSTDFVKTPNLASQVIRITDINNKNTNEGKVYIPDTFLKQNKLDKYAVNNGDLLLSLTGAAGFNFFFWNGGRAVINQRTAKIKPKKKSGRALLRLLESLIHEKINARGEGQNNNLSKEFLNSIVLLIPEPDEQQRIADCLSALDDQIAAQAQKMDTLKTHKKGLMQQLFPAPEDQA